MARSSIRESNTSDHDVQRQARALGDPTRYLIFRYVADSTTSVGVAEITDYIGFNHNAIRQHLAVLCGAGLVVEEVEGRGRPGRPRLLYHLAAEVAGSFGVPGPYERLTLWLLEMLHTGTSAEEVGRAAGERLAETIEPEADPLGALEEAMARSGFRPIRKERRKSVELVMGRCPFAAAAAADQATVCDLHLGLASGLADVLGEIEVRELLAKDPHRAGCQLRLQRPPKPSRGRSQDRDLVRRRPASKQS